MSFRSILRDSLRCWLHFIDRWKVELELDVRFPLLYPWVNFFRVPCPSKLEAEMPHYRIYSHEINVWNFNKQWTSSKEIVTFFSANELSNKFRHFLTPRRHSGLKYSILKLEVQTISGDTSELVHLELCTVLPLELTMVK